MTPRETMDEIGWFHAKSVFTPEEIDQIRKDALKGIEEGYKCDLLSNPHIAGVIADKRIADLGRSLLEQDPVYFGDSTVSYKIYGSGFHKDNPDRHDPNAPDWQSNYSLIRFALYLQDCSEHSGGITLRNGGHKSPSVKEGKIINVKTRKGDIVCWKLTMSHSANARMLGFAPNWNVHPRVMRRVPMFLCKSYDAERLAFFYTLGVNNTHLTRYIDYLYTRTYGIEYFERQKYVPEFVNRAEANGMKIMDFSGRLPEVDTSKQNLEHKDIKY